MASVLYKYVIVASIYSQAHLNPTISFVTTYWSPNMVRSSNKPNWWLSALLITSLRTISKLPPNGWMVIAYSGLSI